MERRVHLRRGAPRHRARHGPGHRADRDHPGRLRDGRDPLRAARVRLRPERRPVGLPVQRDQVLPRRRAGVRAARPGRGDHDGADDARLHRTAGAPPATAAARSRWAGWPPSSPAAATPRSTGWRSPRCARTRSARPATGSTGRGWPTPTWSRSAGRCSTGCSATGRTSWTGSATTCTVTADAAAGCGVGARRGHRGGAAQQRRRWRCGTWRPGCGGNGAVGIHNLMEDAATAEISRSQVWQWVHNGDPAGHRRAGDRRPGAPSPPRNWPRSPARSARPRTRRAGSTDARQVFEQVALADEFADFLTLPAYRIID